MELQITGLLGLLVFIADIWAILNIIQSRNSSGSKLLWIVLILLLPVLGLAIWFFAGPREPR
ncbi:PLDc N-terminal domain-containing protein [Spongiibacter tropicus]|uniref:PLDc N-terminal domain-containing protein n=1 Tax=Spongiibacter tropicus TaxID=454602 RepID=UPI0035BE7F84